MDDSDVVDYDALTREPPTEICQEHGATLTVIAFRQQGRGPECATAVCPLCADSEYSLGAVWLDGAWRNRELPRVWRDAWCDAKGCNRELGRSRWEVLLGIDPAWPFCQRRRLAWLDFMAKPDVPAAQCLEESNDEAARAIELETRAEKFSRPNSAEQ